MAIGQSIIQILLILLLGQKKITGVRAPQLQAESYDFIVVGGGVGGSVIASRLSENGHYSVLLLEAGGLPDPRLNIPALMPFPLIGNSSYVKTYNSVPQKEAALTNGGVVIVTTGRTFGGGSGVNGMLFNRGHPHDYDQWAAHLNDPSWSYHNMLKYFKKVETYHGDFPNSQRGFAGPISVSSPHYRPGARTIYEAASYLKVPFPRSPNGPQTIGFGPMEFSKENGHRVSAFMGYILPYLDRPNLKVIAHALVKRVVFEEKTAIGVIYTRANSLTDELFFVRAKKEVIVCAGPIESPALLMRSGVGPKDILDQAKIPQLMDLPVGRNLMDHPAILLHFLVNNKSEENVFIPERDLNPEATQLYLETGDGPYSTLTGEMVIGFLATNVSVTEGTPDWPDIQVQFYQSPMRTDVPGFSRTGQALHQEVEHDFAVNEVDKISVFAMIYLGRPKSRGTVILNFTNVDADPIIDLNYFSDPSDMQALLDGIDMVMKIYEGTPAYQSQEARYRPSPLKACSSLPYRSEEYFTCFIRQTAHYGLHGSGTCKMGKGLGDPSAVVNTDFEVVGMNKIRVIDSSTLPIIPNSNTQAPTYTIAERGAEVILHKWGGKSDTFFR